MPFLPVLPDEQASPEVRKIYEEVTRHLGRMGMDKSLSRRLSIDYQSAPLDSKVMELLKFCEKLTTRPGDMQRMDIENLRRLGWNDADIFDAVLVTSLFACANRFSAGLGLTPDFD